MTGRVVLVGAGPGDPGLLTLHGQRWLRAAHVVVHDELVHRRVLEHVRPDAELIAVGRPHDDPRRLGQGDIEAVLVARARDGKLVVRLKNGDPFLFGRGAEETKALREAGIPFEIVPGVTSALAVPAYAGIPATHRDHTSLITIATGHQKLSPGGPPGPPPLPWESLAKQGGTLVFLMAVRHLEAVLAALAEHGLDPATPAAAIQQGTIGSQRTVTGTVATLAPLVRAARLRAPAVIVVGSVVALREQVAWYESRPLIGRRIVVTRPRQQSGEFARQLEAHGAEVIVVPTIAIVPAPDAARFDVAVAAAADYDWIVFTSANGVRAFFERFAVQRRDVRVLANARLAAIGPETAAELERRMLHPAVVPAEYRAEGLLDALGDDVRGRRILLPRAAGAREILPETLAARGAQVDEVIAYEAVVPPDADVDGLRAAIAAGTIDAITFTSSSTVRNFVTLLGDDGLRSLAASRTAIACIGPITAATAREHGLAVHVCPTAYTTPALAAALVEHFCKPGTDGLSQEER
jgi:uroporphyrinogen III methyltransferase/synthase